MRNTDEQLHEIMRRSEIVREKRALRKRVLISAAASCVVTALLIAALVYLPWLKVISKSVNAPQYGSLLLSAPYMGYILIMLLAFALGICLTLLCVFCGRLVRKDRNGR